MRGSNHIDLYMSTERITGQACALLVAATKNGAECIGIEDNVGTLTKGKVANIIAVDGNPLEDIQAVKRVAYVMKDGSTFLHT